MIARLSLFEDVATYAARVTPFLMSAEVENNVLLGVLRQLASGEHDFEKPLLLGAVEVTSEESRPFVSEKGEEVVPVDGGLRVPGSADDAAISSVVGCLWRTPPYPLSMTEMPALAADPAAECIASRLSWIDNAFGPVGAVLRFADAWSARTGARHHRGMRRGVFRLDRVAYPRQPAPGEMVLARLGDLPMVIEWGEAFRRDTHTEGGNPAVMGRRRIDSSNLYLWIDGGTPRAMASTVGFTDHGVRIGYVYTPPEQRGRGFASTLVATLSQLLLDRGRTFCCLHADLDNPTSTGIYERLGYYRVVEAVDVVFEGSGTA